MEELKALLVRFAASGWDLTAAPAVAGGNCEREFPVSAIQLAERACGSCGLDPLYRRALECL